MWFILATNEIAEKLLVHYRHISLFSHIFPENIGYCSVSKFNRLGECIFYKFHASYTPPTTTLSPFLQRRHKRLSKDTGRRGELCRVCVVNLTWNMFMLCLLCVMKMMLPSGVSIQKANLFGSYVCRVLFVLFKFCGPECSLRRDFNGEIDSYLRFEVGNRPSLCDFEHGSSRWDTIAMTTTPPQRHMTPTGRTRLCGF